MADDDDEFDPFADPADNDALHAEAAALEQSKAFAAKAAAAAVACPDGDSGPSSRSNTQSKPVCREVWEQVLKCIVSWEPAHMMGTAGYSELEGSLSRISKDYAGVATVLCKHGWSGGAFKQTPTLELLKADVRKAAAAAEPAEAAGILEDSSGDRRFEFVVYGATGYTGCLCVEHFDALFSKPEAVTRRWAIAGRNLDKLNQLAAACKSKPSVCIASTEDEQQLESMAESCSVVLNCVGPYVVHGPPVVAACVRHGTHYVDVAGEVLFMRRILNKYDAQARVDGVSIIPYCGYDAAVFDISGYLLAKRLGPLTSLREYWIYHPIPPKGGPALSGIACHKEASWEEVEQVRHPFTLGGERKCGVRDVEYDPEDAFEQDTLYPSVWLAPGLFGPVTTRCLRRSALLFEQRAEDGVGYGSQVCITSRECVANRLLAKQRTEKAGHHPRSPEEQRSMAENGEAAFNSGSVGLAGLGPGRQMRSEIRSESVFVAQGEDGAWAYVHYTGPEVSEATAIVACGGTLALLEERKRLGGRIAGGLLTPAFAFHGTTFLRYVEDRYFAEDESGNPLKFEVKDGQMREEQLLEIMKGGKASFDGYVYKMMKGLHPNSGNEVPEMLSLRDRSC